VPASYQRGELVFIPVIHWRKEADKPLVTMPGYYEATVIGTSNVDGEVIVRLPDRRVIRVPPENVNLRL